MTLTNQERTLVETNLYLVKKVVHYNITVHESIQGLGYDDLYQIGCEALCRAAQTYKPKNNASFATYANIVIYNHLISHCRKVTRIQNPLEYLDAPLENDNSLTLADTLPGNGHNAYCNLESSIVFSEALTRYKGVYLKGLYALYLRYQGLSNAEIAKYFGTKPHYIPAWIAKATKKMQADSNFKFLY